MKFEKFPQNKPEEESKEQEYNPYSPPQGLEREESPEVMEAFEKLDEKAATVGEQLENLDPSKSNKEAFLAGMSAIERVMGATYMLVGASAGSFAWSALAEGPAGIQKVIAAGVLTLGIGVGVKGFDKLVTGAKGLWDKLSPEQKAQLES